MHNTLIAYMESALNAVLPLPYAAYVEARCYIERTEDSIRPDIILHEKPAPARSPRRKEVAVMEVGDPPMHFHIYPLETREAFITIRDVKRKNRVGTAIELPSHANKTTRNEGRRLYQEKQRKILASDTHLIEVDLLRLGRHTIAVPEEVFQPENRYDYLACLHRAGTGGEFEEWLNLIQDRLPRIAVPLDAGFSDVELDLQTILDRTYDEGAYSRKIDYSQDPVPPLTDIDAAWADALLRERGLRS